MPSLSYRPELDGLRTVAVYLVVAFHADATLVRGGFVGVDLFFVLSGFLVTCVLLRDLDSDDGIRLGRFYARRVRRLLPAALVVVVATACLQVLLLSLPARLDLVADARASVLYVANWHFVVEAGDYFAQGDAPSPFLHFWSLSIEEQLYILFPLLVLATTRWSRRPRRTLAVALAVLCGASVLAQVVTAGQDPSLAYYGTHTRAYQLLAGGLLAVLLLPWGSRRRDDVATSSRPAWAAPLAAAVGLVAVVVLATRFVDVGASARGLATTVAACVAIAGLWLAPHGWTARALALPLPRYLGQVSYGTYLWHWPVTLLLQRVLETRPAVIALLTAVVATGLAALSFRVLETPVRSARPLHGVPWRVVGAGLATSALVVVVLPLALERDARPALAVRSTDPATAAGPAWVDRPVPDVDLVAAAADLRRDDTPPCVVDNPEACVTVDGDGPRVLLLGDSQASMFVPALEDVAADRGWRLSLNVLNACPWQADQVNARADDDRGRACTAARDTFFTEVLPLMDVDVVIAIGLSRSDPFWQDKLSSPGAPAGETLAEMQHRTTTRTAELVRDAGARLVIVHSLLGTDGYSVLGPDPIECLAAARTLGDCAVVAPRERPSVDDTYAVLATEDPDRVATVDLTDVLCSDWPVCRPVADGTVVWRDSDHVTVTFLRQRTDALERELVATGFLG